MPHRTYLTAPPGTEPTESTGRAADEPRERYVPGLSPASEALVPHRLRTPIVLTTILILLVALLVAVLRLSAATQAQDPSLFDPTAPEVQDDPAPFDEGPSLRDGVPTIPGGLPGDG